MGRCVTPGNSYLKTALKAIFDTNSQNVVDTREPEGFKQAFKLVLGPKMRP